LLCYNLVKSLSRKGNHRKSGSLFFFRCPYWGLVTSFVRIPNHDDYPLGTHPRCLNRKTYTATGPCCTAPSRNQLERSRSASHCPRAGSLRNLTFNALCASSFRELPCAGRQGRKPELLEYGDDKKLSRRVAAMPATSPPFVRRITRTRPICSSPSDQSVPPLQVDPTLAEAAIAHIRYDIDAGSSSLAEIINANYYGSFYDKVRVGDAPYWPLDFESRMRGMKQSEQNACRRIYSALSLALTSQWIMLLPSLEFKLMLYVNNRTWAWGKPMECISLRMFRVGHHIGDECTQAGISGSDTRLGGAWRHLEAVGLLRTGLALQSVAHKTALDTIRWYEINVPVILHTANQFRAGNTRDAICDVFSRLREAGL
jgi:hypothetical protein